MSLPQIGRGRCRCASDQCTCTVVSDGTINVIGTGDPDDPFGFVIAATLALQVLDTATVNLTLTGSGTPASPWILSGVAITAPTSTTSIFLSSNPSYLPPGSSMVLVCIGGGGGGGGGEAGLAGGLRGGGGGGQPGALSETFPLAIYANGLSPLAITVGAAGTAGAANGDGGAGGMSQVVGPSSQVLCRAGGGLPGLRGSTVGQSNGGGVPPQAAQVGTQRGGYGGVGRSVTQGDAVRWNQTLSGLWLAPGLAPGGGGGGGSITSANAPVNGGTGGSVPGRQTVGGAGGTVLGSAGSTGGAFTGGGGGASGGASLAGGNGAAGQTYGGGGGGGGASTTGSAPGAGAAGAAGIVVVHSW